MARAGAILAATLDLMEGKIRPGVSTAELDRAAERFIRSRGAEPTFKGYRGFPGSICASPNAMIVHGIPGPYRLKRGDIISIDVGVTLDGWVADAARTFAVEEVSAQAQNLLSATEESLHVGRRAVPRGQSPGRRLERDPARGRGRRAVGRALARGARRRAQHARGSAGAQLRQARQGAAAGGGHGARDRADDDRGTRRGARGGRRLGDLLPGCLPGGPLRVHGRDHRRRPADPDPVASPRREAHVEPSPRASRSAAEGPPRGARAPAGESERSCYHPESCSNARRSARVRASPRPGSGGRQRQPEPSRRNPAAERDHEGKTVGQADVREVQDHPPPRRGAGDLPEQAPQAAAGVDR